MKNVFKIFVSTILIFTSDCLDENQKTHENVENLLSKSSEPYKHVLKRYDQEYQTCLENFEIRDDKIIRTQDSRDMGAKYITEFDLGSRDECLRACCGMETCDVFVFEEKNPGSCYLFHCGPSDDFKCKFTKHHNYTSAILQTNRHLSELETQIKLTKHEQELSRLRMPKITRQSTGSPLLTTMLVPEPSKETMQLAPTVSNGSTFNRHCSSYQFECRTSNECIAIYNACDGIPQCADGSDEAPELACPSQGTTPPPALLQRQTMPPQPLTDPSQGLPSASLPNSYNSQQGSLQQQLPIQQQTIDNQRDSLQQSNSYNNNGGPPFRPLPQQQWQPNGQQQPLQSQQYPSQNSDMNNQPKLFPQGSNQGLPGKMYGIEGEGPANNFNTQWNNYQHVQANPYQGGHLYEDGNSHIFNHKGNGLMADSDRYNYKSVHPSSRYNSQFLKESGQIGERAPGQFSDSSRSDYKYSPSGNNNDGGNNNNNNMYYNNPLYRQPAPQNTWGSNQHLPPHDSGPVGNLAESSHNDNDRKLPMPPDYYYEDSQAHEARFHPSGETEPHSGYSHHVAEKISPQLPAKNIEVSKPAFVSPLDRSPEEEQLKVVHANKGNIEVQVRTETTPSRQEVTSIASSKAKQSPPASKPKVEPTATDIALALEGIEVEASKPTGAILSLSLGMCICAIFMALVSCRVRMIRKRLRRGGKSPYTHDADYLVNGMYL